LTIYGAAEFKRIMPDDQSEKLTKREFGKAISKYNRPEINKAMDWIKSQKDKFEQGWEFLSVGKCVGAIREANRHQALHHEYIAIDDSSVVTKKEGADLMADMRKGLFE